MIQGGQRLQPERYACIVRTLSFILSGNRVLLLRVGERNPAWAGKLNGLGGHVERGETPRQAALREIKEEAGLAPQELDLCGVVLIDTGRNPGIALLVYVGRVEGQPALKASGEGEPLWLPLEQLTAAPLVEDLHQLLPRALAAYRQGRPFSGLYTFSAGGELQMEWDDGQRDAS